MPQPYGWCRRSRAARGNLLSHLGDVHCEAGFGQQRDQLENAKAVACNIGAAIDIRFRLDTLAARVKAVDVELGFVKIWSRAAVASGDGFCNIAAHEFGPVLRKQLGVGEEIGPEHASVDGDHHTDCPLVAQLTQDCLLAL